MCGIYGCVGKTAADIRPSLDRLAHRGPDHSAVYQNGRVTFGHRRLSIIDLSDRGNQPMTSASGRTVIVFNGEIYNHQVLRASLKSEGAVFKTESDTEVILEGYERHGAAFFNQLRGMWALVIHDTVKDEIVCARDAYGIKPLFYAVVDGVLHFSSELRALRAAGVPLEPDPASYAFFFNLGYFLAPATPYRGVMKVLPGDVLSWKIADAKMVHVLRVSRFAGGASVESDGEPIDVLERALIDSVEAHYVSDVPVSLLLSGGNDSSLLAALSKKLGKRPAAYHVAVSGSPDTAYAERVAKLLDLPLVIEPLSQDAFAEMYEQISETLDEPTGDLSIIPTTLIYRRIKGQAKVVLSGEGGDELFGGYSRNRLLVRHSRVATKNSLNGLLNRLVSARPFGVSYSNPVVQRVRAWALQHRVTDDLIGAYLKAGRLMDYPFRDAEVRTEMARQFVEEMDERIPRHLAFDTIAYLPNDLLYKSDNASMASSIEARVPLVDRFLGKVVADMRKRLPASAFEDKRIMKEILLRHLPKELVYRPKSGFGVPMASYDAKKFVNDFQTAAAFHVKERASFGLDSAMVRLLERPSACTIIARKFPRFAFALITNWKLFSR
jgi:asparagine synthase (glutamine-hydrolysing)